MSVTGQIYSIVSLFPEWNSFGHRGYLGAAEFTVGSQGCLTLAEFELYNQKWRNQLFFGFSAKFCLTVMRCTCVASGKVEKLVIVEESVFCV